MLVAAWLAAAFSARQPQAVALDVGLSGIRISLTFLVLVWVQELITKELEKRTVFFVLAYPTPRSSYLLGRYFGILLLSAAALVALGLILRAVIAFASWGYQYPNELHLGWPYWAAVVGIFLDVAVVGAFAIAVAAVATSSILPLAAGAGFAVAGRMLGPVLDYLSRGAEGDTQLVERFDPLVRIIRWLLPDLDRLDLRMWPLFGTVPDPAVVTPALIMASSYTVVLLALAIVAFNRRQFV